MLTYIFFKSLRINGILKFRFHKIQGLISKLIGSFRAIDLRAELLSRLICIENYVFRRLRHLTFHLN